MTNQYDPPFKTLGYLEPRMAPFTENWPMSRLDDAIARIVDERGTDADWQTIIAYRDRLGNDVVMKAAQDAALKLRKSRVTTYGTSCPATIPLASRLRPLTTHNNVGRKPIA